MRGIQENNGTTLSFSLSLDPILFHPSRMDEVISFLFLLLMTPGNLTSILSCSLETKLKREGRRKSDAEILQSRCIEEKPGYAAQKTTES